MEFDYVVVGAGPSGCAVAAGLAEAPGTPSVALIETGPAKASFLSDMPLGIAALVPFRSRANYGYETVPQPALGGRTGYVPRGRGLGGSSLINAMVYTRGQPEDYDGWAAAGCAGWGWADVLPLFRRSEANVRGADDLHGAEGPLVVSDLASPSPVSMAFVEAAARCQFPRNGDFNGPRQEGVGLYQVFQKNGRRHNAARAYLGVTPPANLQLLADNQARRLLFEGRRAVGVAIGGRRGERRGGGRVVRARREIVVAAGAIGSPHLLMLSGIGPAEQLRRFGIEVVRDAPGVGENLQDHLDYTANMAMRAPGLIGMTPSTLWHAARAIGAYRRAGAGLLTSNVAEAGGFLRSRPELTRPDLQLHFCIALVDDHNRKMHLKTGIALHVCALRPASRGSVRLAGADPARPPAIDPGFLTAPQDMATMLAGARIAHRILAAEPLARYGGTLLYGSPDAPDAELRDLIRDHSDTIYHPVGTCRMGADAASVVDPALRVRGVTGLRVADASIMPMIVSGNTQAPSAMIGEKAAELMLRAG